MHVHVHVHLLYMYHSNVPIHTLHDAVHVYICVHTIESGHKF